MDSGDNEQNHQEMNSEENKVEENVTTPPSTKDEESHEEDKTSLDATERSQEEELLKPAEGDEDVVMDCNDAEETELLNLQEGSAGIVNETESMDGRKSNCEEEAENSEDHNDEDKQAVGTEDGGLEKSDDNEEPDSFSENHENANENKEESDVDGAKETDTVPTGNEDELEDVEDGTNQTQDENDESRSESAGPEINEENEESETLKENHEADNTDSVETDPVTEDKMDVSDVKAADASNEVSSTLKNDNEFQVCSIQSINSPLKVSKSGSKVETKSDSENIQKKSVKSVGSSVDNESVVDNTSNVKSDTEDRANVETKLNNEDSKEEEKDTTSAEDNKNNLEVSSVESAAKETEGNCESSESTSTKTVKDVSEPVVNSEESTVKEPTAKEVVKEDTKNSDMVDTSEIKKEPGVETNVESGSTAEKANNVEDQNNKNSSTVQAEEKQSTNVQTTVADSTDKPSVPKDSSTEVKVKEEALSPSTQNESEKTDKKETTNKDVDSTSQDNESDSTDAQKKSSASSRTCAECGVGKGLKYQVLFQGKTRFLCSDVCFKAFRGKQKLAPAPSSQGTKSAVTCGICNREIKSGQGFFPYSGDSKPVCSEECMVKYQQAHTPKPSCAQCKTGIESRTKCLIWETMEFCNEDCLGSYQATMGSHCACCKTPVQRLSLGKYCVRFGADIRQFCTGKCLEEFKKGLKVCTFCQKDMSNTSEGFLAPIGDKFRDFCTSDCMERYEVLNATTSKRPAVQKCSVCQKVAAVKVQVNHKDKDHVLCSDPCIAAFRYTQKIYANLCDLCHKLFNNQPLCLQIDNSAKKFCTKTCLNLFVLAHRKIVPCTWCKVKKYNFDMIERVDTSSNVQQFCSLNCLSLFRVSLNATSSKCIKCDHCHMNLPAQYHLTMSDASIRNFCSYPCVIKFQGQFTSVPTLTTVTPSLPRQGPTPVGKATTVPPSGPVTTTTTSDTPVIANVMSLAGVTTSSVSTAAPKTTITQSTNSVASSGTTTNGVSMMREVHREVIVAPPVPRMLKNKMIMCKPLVQNKGVACKPHPCHKETQTDSTTWGTPIVVPIPVPIYVPAPVHMFSRSVPFPMPFPVPIPVPIFIPTTRTTTAKVIKDIFEIQEKVPSNPYEAELLLMAEMVAADAGKEEEEKEKEEDEKDVKSDTAKEENKEEDKTDTGSLLDEPLEDLEDAVPPLALEDIQPVVALTPLAPEVILNETFSEESIPAEEVVKPTPVNSYARRGGKRPRGRGRGGRGRKRQKITMESDTSDEEWLPTFENLSSEAAATKSSSAKVISVPPKTSSSPIVSVAPIVTAVTNAIKPELKTVSSPEGGSPDANHVLKYMFGVNAWKHWVIQKNVQLEKGGSQARRLKLFKTDILQLSPDELNYSLCLFVKEVRKPNGEEYAPDSIYYLCLGVQMNLYENGRIDNIFTDPYYEKFTECLHDVLMKHEVMGTLRKEAHFISRIEEEILWESKQLGAHSPQVLLNTLMYFNTKQFNLQSVDDHLALSFTYIMKGWRKVYNHGSVPKGSRCAVLRYYPPPARGSADKKGWREDTFTYEQEENFDNPLRCPVKLYEFYLSKCPESVRQRNDLFYMCPERSCVPDSPVWYSMQALPKESIVKMLQRISLVREIFTSPAPAVIVPNESRANGD